KGRRTIFFKDEMSDPGKRVAKNEPEQNPFRGHKQTGNQKARADERADIVQPTTLRIQMLRQIKWPEFREALIARRSFFRCGHGTSLSGISNFVSWSDALKFHAVEILVCAVFAADDFAFEIDLSVFMIPDMA